MDFVVLKNLKLPTRIALTQEEQRLGLMYEKKPQIMSFVYSEPRRNEFWMKNTHLPLDLIFCRANKIVAIFQGLPFSKKLIGSDILSDLVVEAPQGTADRLNLQPGDQVKLEYSSDFLKRLLTF